MKSVVGLPPIPVRFVAACGIALAAHTSPLVAQTGAGSAQGLASAEIVEPISVVSLADLSFGGIAASPSENGEVTIAAESGVAEYTGGARAACLAAAGCHTGAAVFALRGEPGRDYALTLPDGAVALPQDGSGRGLPVSSLTAWSRNLAMGGPSGRLDETGDDEVRIGGTLDIPAGTAPGTYAAELHIVVSYS